MSKHTVKQSYLDHFKLTPSLYASYTDTHLCPETTRVLGAWGDIEKNTLSFVVSTPFSERFLSIAEEDQRVALVSVTLSDYLAYQYKGSIRSIRPTNDEEMKVVNQYIETFCKLVTYVGIDPVRYRPGFATGPYTTIEFELDSVFDQTPRVGAGAPVKMTSTVHA